MPETGPYFLPENEDESLHREKYENDLDDERVIEEQKLAYYYWLTSLDRRVESGDLSTDAKNKILSSFIVEKDLANENLYTEARHDKLTGLPNKKGFEEELEKAIEEGEDFGVLLLDLDHFKEVNDTYGHGAGDLVLMQSGMRLKTSIRQDVMRMPGGMFDNQGSEGKHDFAARIGGEEEAIIVRNINDESDLKAIADRLNAMFRDTMFPIKDNQGSETSIPVTVSIGGALFQKGETNESLLQKADERLYAAKDRGKNCAVVADEKYK